jgi:transitional endoplasmic reticulum ATPase
VEFDKISEITEGFSGADISAIANTAISLVLHEYLQRYSTPEEAAKHASNAFISMQHFDNAVNKIKTQREMKSKQRIGLSQYM